MSKSGDSQFTRRDVVAGSLVAVGTGAVLGTQFPDTAVSEPAASAIPRRDRGSFLSNGQLFIPRGQGFDATVANFYEVPLEDPDYLEVWCYTDKLSYLPGEQVEFHTSTTGKELCLEVYRDGSAPEVVHSEKNLPGELHKLPADFFEKGCGWPVSHRWRIPDDLATGFYVVVAKTTSSQRSRHATVGDAQAMPDAREYHHGFFVRRAAGSKKSRTLFLSSTCTWTAYNDWGGFSHYVGHDLPDGFTHAPRLTIHRPFARGIIWSPEGAPRKPHHFKITQNSIPLYPVVEFAFARGYSKWYSNCGWATYERPFALFCEQHRIEIDFATQLDLHSDPHLLDDYKCVVMVGHCEYWTWEMREAIDRFVESGGNVARFAGNFAWQIRLEDDCRTQVAYKYRAHEWDPVRNTDQRRRITALWEDPAVDWPGTGTFGLNANYGIYAHVGVNVPRGTGGFTVYRPEHWAFAGTDLYYGDDFGGEARIFGYEVDGLDYTFRDGIPVPTFTDHAQPNTEILAMGLASNVEADHGHPGSTFYYGDGSEEIAMLRYGKVTAETRKAAARGNGMIITFERGKGQVFHAGSCEWVAGLKSNDWYTATITRNVLMRFSREA